jgi:aminoglycoside 6-adenylyltransferase
MSAEARDPFLKHVLAWAEARNDVRLVLRTGSRARPNALVDAFSDHDLELFVLDPSAFAKGKSWSDDIAPTVISWSTPVDEENHTTRLALFEGGHKIDFQVFHTSRLTEMAADGLDDDHERGYDVLLDKDQVADRLPPPSYTSTRNLVPAQGDLEDVATEFWWEAAQIPGDVVRGDLWVLKFRDWTMKEQLLTLMEWEAFGRHQGSQNVGYYGKGLRLWGNPTLYDQLPAIFTGFDETDSLRGLNASAELFMRLSRVVAAAFGLDDGPLVAMEQAVTPYLRSPNV